MKIGIIRTSRKENERRVPIYPEHLPLLQNELLSQLCFETGYGADYGFDDAYFADLGACVAERSQILRDCALVVLPKPMLSDYQAVGEHRTIIGWHHCVQQRDIAQVAIDKKLTLIAWEAMHHWSSSGEKLLHVFYKNNELAGYAAVLHCLQILGIDGHYGRRKNVVVLSYGSVSRGAIYALQGRGFNNIHVFTRRHPHLVADQNPDVYYGRYFVKDGEVWGQDSEGVTAPLINTLEKADIICNGVLQDVQAPMMFVPEQHVARLKPRSLIVDISCDAGMGFAFARPTTFRDPVFQVGNHVTYYSVDHTPTYLWHAASREVSRAFLPYLPLIAGGPTKWDDTISRAVEIREGSIVNENIISFQRREHQPPYAVKEAGCNLSL